MNEGIGTDGIAGNDHYRMTVDLNVLDHLGINLYSNIAAVLTEAVANAWDADAENVEIGIDPDGKFIEIKETATGVKFDNPVLDAQLLSVFAQPDIAEHSLNAIAQQLGIDVIARHTAIGDAMTTAAVFVKLLDLLSARGVETFGQAIQISTRMMEQRRKLLHA